MKRLVLVALVLASVLLGSMLLRRNTGRASEEAPMPPELRAERVLAPAELPGSAEVETSERTPIEVAANAADGGSFPLSDAPPSTPAPLHFHALVLDALTRRPIAGARAWGTATARSTEFETSSDAEGRFELFVPPALAIGLGHVTAEGYGQSTFVFDRAHDSPARADELELLPAAGLDVFARTPEGRPLAGIEVTLHWPGEPVARGDAVMHMIDRASWAKRTDEDGVARFDALSPEAELAWRVSRSGDSVWREGRLAFAPGERGRLDVVLGGAARVAGRVRDEHGAGVGELRLFISPASNWTHHGDYERMRQATSDATGAFEFLAVPFDTYFLGCGQNTRAFLAQGETLTVDRDLVERDLVVRQGLFLSGRALGTAEELQSLDGVLAQQVEGGDRTGGTFVDGAFRIGPLAPGEYLVFATGEALATAVVRAPAGASGVELPVVRAREILVRVEGAADEYGLTLFDLEREVGMLWSESEPLFTLDLAPGRHALQVTTADGRVGLLAELVVTADEPRGEVVVRLEQGANCTFVHRATSVTRTLRLSVGGAPLGFLTMLGNHEKLLPGASRTVLLPPGRLAAELLEGNSVAAHEELLLQPGERRRIELAPR